MTNIIITSSKDIASMKIKEELLSNFNFVDNGSIFDNYPIYVLKNNPDVQMITLSTNLVNAEHLNCLNSDLLVFASQHSAKSEKPALLCHFSGNWLEDTKLGGFPKELGFTASNALKVAMCRIKDNKEKFGLIEYSISIEATHHGPTSLKSPLIFIELGSNEKNWRDSTAAKIIANACYEAVINEKKYKTALAFGSGHYSSQFTKIILNSDLSLSHIAPKHIIDKIDKEMIEQAIKKSSVGIDFFLVDHKGLKASQRIKIDHFAEQLGYKILRVKNILKESK